MRLLNRGTEVVTVYPEVTVTDRDGNTLTKPGSMGIPTRASVQPISSTEPDAPGGSHTVSKYRLWPVVGPLVAASSAHTPRSSGAASGTRSTGTPSCTPAARGPLTRSTRWFVSRCAREVGITSAKR
jgi:hypothetical protein